MTPTQREAYLKKRRFHADISRKAALLAPKDALAKAIPARPEASRTQQRDNGDGALHRGTNDMAAGEVDDLGWQVEVGGFDRAHASSRQTGTAITFIQEAVARRFNLTVQEMVSACKLKNVVLPRQLAMYLAKTVRAHTLVDIGANFGDRDHSTVIHAIRKIEHLVATDSSFAKLVASLRDDLQTTERNDKS